MTELLFKDEVFAIIGAAMEVHTVLGPGFLEAVYYEAMEIEATVRGLPFELHKKLTIRYKDRVLDKAYEADMVFDGQIIVEFKALDRLTSREDAQILNYLKATGLRVGVLINFGSNGRLEWKRMVR